MADEALEEVVEAMARAVMVRNGVHPDDDANRADEVACQRTALAAAEALGFKLIARESSEDMEDGEARDELLHDRMGGRLGEGRLTKATVLARVWRAMWDAAPSARETEGGVR